jgi:hypothetical protein
MDFLKENFMKLMKNIYFYGNKYYEEKKDFYELILKINENNGIFCKHKWISKNLLQLIFLLLLFTLIWFLITIINNVYNYLKLTSFLYMKDNSRLIDSPLFIQLKNVYYFNDYFSIDMSFLIFIITPLIILAELWILKYGLDKYSKYRNVFIYTEWFCYLIIIFGIIYYLLIYKDLITLGARLNTANNIIYNNINADFINSQKICNYLNKKTEFDYEFVYGKCNDIRNNIAISKLYNYIKSITKEIQQNIAPIANIDVEKFKTLKDKNGILYKDKITSALFTFQLVKYYIDNDLIEEAKDFFSAYNLLYLNKINLLRKKINPILYLRFDNLIVFNNTFQYNKKMADSFGQNKEIYNYIYGEINKIQNTIQNVVVDIYNICSYKLISVYVYYLIVFLLLIIFIIIYISYN